MSSTFGESALMVYGNLLSNVFERSFDLHQLVDQHKILDYTLNWAPFATYVKLLCKNNCHKHNLSFMKYRVEQYRDIHFQFKNQY